MGQPYGGFPEPLRTDALRGRRKLDKRPGLFLEPVDFAKVKKELGKKTGGPVTECDIASYVMYPKVFEDFRQFQQNPSENHWEGLVRIAQFLISTADQGMLPSSGTRRETFSVTICE